MKGGPVLLAGEGEAGNSAAAPRSLWRNRDFGLLISGRVISYVGSQVAIFAMPLLVLAISHSATAAGIVLSLGNLSWLVFGLVAGAFADRWNRKATMIVSDLCRALLMISIPVAMWLHGLTLAQLCVVAVLSGVFATLFNSADAAALPNVVPPGQLAAALGYFESATNTVRIGGSMVAGALFGLGRAVPFIADCVSYACSAISLRFTRAGFETPREEGGNDGSSASQSSSLMAEIRAGVGWLFRQQLVRFLVLISAADSVRYGAGYLIIITLAQRLGASSVEIGFVFTGAAVGALLGSLAAKRVTDRFRLGRIAIVTLWVEALMFPLYAYAPDVLLLAAVAAAEALVAPIYLVALSSYRLAATPDELRGRTSSAVLTLTTGAMSVGALLGGKLIASVGARHATLLFGGLLVLLAGLTTANRTVRHSSDSGERQERTDDDRQNH